MLGDSVVVGAGARIDRSVVLAGAQIGAGCVLRDCIVAERAKIGDDAELEGDVVIGEDAEVQERRLVTTGARVDPGARV